MDDSEGDGDMADNDNRLAESGDMALTRGQRLLKSAVLIMGVILILGFLGVFLAIAWRMGHKKPPAPVPSPSGSLELAVSAADIREVSLDGTHLLVRTPAEILIVDTQTGTILTRLHLKP